MAADVESMARHLESERQRLRGALAEILKWVDENVQPANSLMGVKPKTARSGGGGEPPAASDLAAADDATDADDGAPTLNLQSAPDNAVSGAPRLL